MEHQIAILAGGFGTRLRSAVPDLPKVLAPVAGRAFLDVLVATARRQGFRRFVFLLGHQHEKVEAHLRDVVQPCFPDAELAVSVEPRPLGTAGAVQHAASLLDDEFFVLNGDSYLEFDAPAMLAAHRRQSAVATIGVREMDDTARYGRIDVDEHRRVTAFREKADSSGPGLINAGIYLLSREVLDAIPPGVPVSIEKETFPALIAADRPVVACPQSGRFIDIGTPESYQAFAAMLAAGEIA